MPDDDAVFEHIAAVGDPQAFLRVLLDEQQSDAGLAHPPQGGEQLLHHGGREPERRLVEQQDIRVGHQRAADGEHLLFAAAHGARDLGGAFAQARKQPEHLFAPRRFAVAGALRVGAEQEIFLHRQVAEDAAPFGHQRQSAFDDLMGRQRRDIAAGKAHLLARKRSHDARDGFQQRGLARAVGAEDRHDLAAPDVEGDAVERAMLAIGQAEIGDLKHRRPPRRDRLLRQPHRSEHRRLRLRRSCGRCSSRHSGRTARAPRSSHARPARW